MQQTIEKLKSEIMSKVYHNMNCVFLACASHTDFSKFLECAYFPSQGALSTSLSKPKAFSLLLILSFKSELNITSIRKHFLEVLVLYLLIYFYTIIQWQYCNVGFISGEYSLWVFLFAENRAGNEQIKMISAFPPHQS